MCCRLLYDLQLLQQLMMNNPSGAVSLAKMVAKQTPPPVDINTMADLFLQVLAAVLGAAAKQTKQHNHTDPAVFVLLPTV